MRRVRLLLMATVAVVAAACTEQVARDPGIDAVTHVEDRFWPAARVWKLDVLFVVDDTIAMAPYQQRIAELPALVESLLVDGGRDVRIAVTTNDGVLRTAPGMTDPFVSVANDYDLSRITNYEGSFQDTFAALLDVGAEGTGAAVPLAAAASALDGSDTGFVRKDAPLGIVFVTATDDGSLYPPGDYETFFKSLKADPSLVFVTGIAGEQTPRIDEMFAMFINRNVRVSLDDADYSRAVGVLAQLIRSTLGQPYLYASDVDPDAPGPQYDCTFTAVYNGSQHVLPPCSNDRDQFCWSLHPDVNSGSPDYVVPKIPPYAIAHFQPDLRAQCVVLH